MNWYGIAALRALGLAWDLKLHKLNTPHMEPAAPVVTPVDAPVSADLAHASSGD
jgi:hypothetical protein